MMEKNIKITVITCLLAVVLVLVLTYLRITGDQTGSATAVTLTAEELRELGAVVYEEPVVLQPFSLTDHRGQVFSQNNLTGGWSLIFFGFTSCPDICPLTLAELSQFYKNLPVDTLAKDTKVIMVSVDPDRDTTEKLAEYMATFHEDFVGVNGPYADVAALAKQLFIAHSPPPSQASPQNEHAGHGVDAAAEDDYVIDHSGNILMINPEGRYHGFFDAAIQDRELTQAYEAIRAAY
ncbi:MAG: SCO family protein [Gammaproteobacteria bacterium]|nr:SCO family protein [Gammaproteobacteria bacterium]